jgi:catechol 2,3-dioxygenase-like lactoylglutathione lyase family enzyme
MTIDHIGYAVKRIERARSAFEKLGFTFEPAIDDTDRNIKLAFGVKDGYRIELVAPLDKKQESPVDQYLSNVVGTPYHICYKSDDFDKEISEMLKMGGWKVVIEPKPAKAFYGRRVVFMFGLSLGLIEVVEGEKQNE